MAVDSLVGTVFSGLSALVVEGVTDDSGMVVVTARTRDVAVPCPVCGTATAKVHGYHQRTVKDVQRFIEVYDAKERAVTARLEQSEEK